MDNCDFSGYATRNDLLCGDGVTIRKDAFKGNDGCEVPLVWNHEHNDPNAVLGHAVLENRDVLLLIPAFLALVLLGVTYTTSFCWR